MAQLDNHGSAPRRPRDDATPYRDLRPVLPHPASCPATAARSCRPPGCRQTPDWRTGDPCPGPGRPAAIEKVRRTSGRKSRSPTIGTRSNLDRTAKAASELLDGERGLPRPAGGEGEIRWRHCGTNKEVAGDNRTGARSRRVFPTTILAVKLTISHYLAFFDGYVRSGAPAGVRDETQLTVHRLLNPL